MSQNKFLYEANSVWDQELQLGQKNLVGSIIDFFPKNVKTVLDVGCGDGKLTQRIIDSTKCSVVGLDSSEEALSRCQFKTILGDATELPFSEGEFDVVLTTDMLEHLPDTVEPVVLDQLFRVAKKWVVIAVPFREELLEATTRCLACGGYYHVNWHLRSYDFDDLLERTPDDFEIDKIVLTGEAWSPYHPLEIKFRRQVYDEWSGWTEGICPYCENQSAPPDPMKPFSFLSAMALAKTIYPTRLESSMSRNFTEILVFYKKKGVLSKQKNITLASSMLSNVGKILPNKEELNENLIPYPFVARAVQGAEGGVILQFPAYENCHSVEIEIFPGLFECDFSIEDGLGILYQGTLNNFFEGKHKIDFSREAVASYYGILMRIQSCDFLKSVQFGVGKLTNLFVPNSSEPVSYGFIEGYHCPVYVQVTEPLYCDEQVLMREDIHQSGLTAMFKNLEEIMRKIPGKNLL